MLDDSTQTDNENMQDSQYPQEIDYEPDEESDRESDESSGGESSGNAGDSEDSDAIPRHFHALSQPPNYMPADLLKSLSKSGDMDVFTAASGKRPNMTIIAEKFGLQLRPSCCKTCHKPRPLRPKKCKPP